jgi:ABC-type nitrate/sulfonate/bicarbonate transport system substrate-binding protein
LGLLATASVAQAQTPVEIRVGTGPLNEEQMYLMNVRKDLTPNQGKAYKLSFNMFNSSNDKIRAFEAGQIDVGSSGTTAAIFAASKGIVMMVFGSMTRDADDPPGATTSFLVLKDSGITGGQTLKGKTIALGGLRSGIELMERLYIRKQGLDPDRDTKVLLVPFAQIGDALRAKKVDVGVFPGANLKSEMDKGDVRILFTTYSAANIAEEFAVFFSPAFVAKNRPAVQAWLADFVAVTKYLLANQKAARQSVLDAKLISVDPAIYVNMTAKDDLVRPADSKPDIQMWTNLEKTLFEEGFSEKRVDVRTIVDTSLLPN